MVPWLTTTYGLTFAPCAGGFLGTSARFPAMKVLRKPNTGKADSLNAGWKMAAGEIVVTLDADTYVEPGALEALRDGFVEDPHARHRRRHPRPLSASARHGPGFFQFFQTFEYARGFLWRLTWTQYRMLVLISGAFAAYRKTVLEAAGGFDVTSWVEDYELTHRIYKSSYNSGNPVTVKTLNGRPRNHGRPRFRRELPQPTSPLVCRLHRHPL